MISDTTDKLFSPFCCGRLLVGFSGGADSTAALLTVWEWSRNHPDCLVEAVHFDHHLRGEESDREAAAAAEFATVRQIPFRKIDLQVCDNGDGVEAAAREARLAEWKKLYGGDRKTAIVLGHHADDRIENLFIRLLRGSNASGLTALRPSAMVSGVRILRPLLAFSRKDIEEFLRSRGVETWQNDSSNSSGGYSRNYWRNTLLPMLWERFPWGHGGVVKALYALDADARFIESAADSYYASGDPGSGDFWRGADEALLPRLLRRFLADKCGCDIIPPPSALERLNDAVAGKGAGGEGVMIPVCGDMALFFQDEHLDVALEKPADVEWRWRECDSVKWGDWVLTRRWGTDKTLSGVDAVSFDATQLPEVVQIGVARAGERMIPFGRKNPELLHKLRIDRRVRAHGAPPVMRDLSGTVLWACGVRRSAGALLGEDSTDGVCFYCTKRV